MGTAAVLARGGKVAHAMREHPRRLIPFAVLLVALSAWAGYRAWVGHRPYTWGGTVEARDIAVGSRVGGRVKEVLVLEGELVKAGQPLVVLEPGDLPAQRLQAEGQLLQAQATLDRLMAGARPEEIAEANAGAAAARAALRKSEAGSRTEQVARARAELAAAQSALDKAALDTKRARSLFSQQVTARAELDAAEAALQQARAQRDARKAALEELERGTRAEDLEAARAQAREAQARAQALKGGSREEDIRAQRGMVEAARGRLEAIDVAIAELTIRTPVDARVEAIDLRPGDLLAPNATAATLLEQGQLYVRIYVPETHLGQLRVGSEVPVRVDSFPKRTFTGVIEHIASEGEYTPRNLQAPDERAQQVFSTRIGLRDDGQHLLRAGMAAYVEVPR